jgi:long-chain acyl-CoA synthetase
MDEIAALCKQHKLNSLEKPKDIYITMEPLSIENDCMTPTMKIKRNNAAALFKKQIDAMYEEIEKNAPKAM